MIIRNAIVLVLSVLLLSTTACGGGDDSKPTVPPGLTLEELLPFVVPTTEEYSAILDDWGNPDAFVDTEEYRTNEDLTGDRPGDLLFVSDGPEAIEASGRQTGYLAGYSGGRSESWCCTARVAVDLFDSEDAAQSRLERELRYPQAPNFVDYPIPSFSPDDIGDSAVAWLEGISGGDPVCPCQLWFRVGPFVGAIQTSYRGPAPTHLGPALEPVQQELALLMAERMQVALASASPDES